MIAQGKPSAVYANRLQRYPDTVWLIWSNKWGCWYRDKCQGYTDDIAQAGLYDRATASRHYITGPKKHRDVEPFPLSSVRTMLFRRRAEIEREASALIDRINAALAGRLACPSTEATER
ncbi:hypothetical protein DAH66_12850 [Sphingomonas koreensis]|uniref:Uncharacterized protein n=1 Tax=Sphingomonas koreensis TaxID=93064 RepID=A0A430G2F3_9SPHN|nr:hypothetical protein [Sphingomonas koreensis]RSY83151.1 hypothetical protein DAH66_12850 [Sphingomonas koreensis]